MKLIKNFAMIPVIIIAALAIFSACKDPIGVEEPNANTSAEARAFMKIAEKSPSLNSFTPNYSEEEAMALSKAEQDFNPIKVWQKFKLTSKNLKLEKDSTTAIGTFTQNFEGTLFIAGSFQKETMGVNSHVDTVIEKPFSTTITRMIKFDRIDNTGNDTLDWKVTGISLPTGGTIGDDINIVKITLTAHDGSEVVIDNPNTFFFDVGKDKNYDFDRDKENFVNFGFGVGNKVKFWKKLFTWYRKNQSVKLSVEILSSSPNPDMLTITHGASMNGKHQSKEKFNLVSSVQEGNFYRKIYERNWKTDSNAGRKHVVINALPRISVYDSESAVVEKTWGVPYKIQ